MDTNESDRPETSHPAPIKDADETPFEMGELEEIDPPLLPWRRRKPVEMRRPARTDVSDAG
jgi:hypothetical protein